MFNFNFDVKESLEQIAGQSFDLINTEDGIKAFMETLPIAVEKLNQLPIDLNVFKGRKINVAILRLQEHTDFKAGFSVINEEPWVFLEFISWDAIAHELLHVHQYLSGRFDIVIDLEAQTAKFMWEGKEHKYLTQEDFLNAPWEKEVYSQLRSLYNKEELATFNKMLEEFTC